MRMEKILGNYLTQANRDFPLDCETLDYLQGLTALAGVIGNIAGDRVVLWGCEAEGGGTRRGAGYVFVRTQNHPEGEVLPWEGGPTASGMYIKQEDISVNANNTDYPKAYTRRSLAPGIGMEHFSWDDFTDIRTMRELMEDNRELREELAGVRPSPLGVVELWAGSEVPEGYVLCNGQALRITDYPGLYKALGTTFNTALNAEGKSFTTEGGFFRVPDLRGRFVTGQHDSDSDYLRKGMAGGLKKVALTDMEIAGHSHEVRDYMMIPHGERECRRGTWTVGGEVMAVGYDEISGNPKRCDTGDDKRNAIQWLKHSTGMSGAGEAHENRPPYYVLAYIMRAK